MIEKKHRNSLAVSAFFTIEAGVVIPIIFVLLVCVISLTFYVHDAIAVQTACMETAVKNAEAVKKEEQSGIGELSQELDARMLLMRNAKVVLETEKNSLTVQADAASQYPSAMVRDLLTQSANGAAYKVCLDHLDARKEILGYKALSDGLSTIDIEH